MAVIIGATKGFLRGVALLVLVALVPGLAMLVAFYADGFLGMGFTAIFFAVLGLEVALSLPILFGIASEVQKSHSETLDQNASEREAGPAAGA
jgi:hypothetical protein